MKKILKQIIDNHRTLKEARIMGRDVDPLFVIKDTLINIYAECASFLISIVLIKMF